MSFDTLAPFYRGLETVIAGRVLQRSRTSFLSEITPCQHALLLGEGPGRFLVELLRSNTQAKLTCVENSPRMIEESIRQMKIHGLSDERVRFTNCDVMQWRPPPGVFDLVVTHFFLDCFRASEIEDLVSIVAPGTTSSARWLLADFRTPEGGWQRWRACLIHALMYRFFRMATGLSASRLTPPDKYLQACGFQLQARRLFNCGLLHSDLWQRIAA